MLLILCEHECGTCDINKCQTITSRMTLTLPYTPMQKIHMEMCPRKKKIQLLTTFGGQQAHIWHQQQSVKGLLLQARYSKHTVYYKQS